MFAEDFKVVGGSRMKGCDKLFTHKVWGKRICGQFEDLKHSDHYIYCPECSEKIVYRNMDEEIKNKVRDIQHRYCGASVETKLYWAIKETIDSQSD